VKAWAERDLGECPFLICDALHVKMRRQEAVRSTTVLLAVGVTEEGQRFFSMTAGNDGER
jgi:transposase-like protein